MQRRQSDLKSGGHGPESKNFDVLGKFSEKFRFFQAIFTSKKLIFQGKFSKNFDLLGNFTKKFDFIGEFRKNVDFFGQFHKQKIVFQGKFPKNFDFSGNFF